MRDLTLRFDAVSGVSWHGLLSEHPTGRVLPEGSRAKFYRSSAGAEIDLVIILPGGPKWAIEIKRSLSPKVERGFITFVNISNRNAA